MTEYTKAGGGAGRTAEAVRERVGEGAAEAKGRASELLSEQRNVLIAEVLGIARALQTTRGQLEQQGQGAAAWYAGRVGSVTEDLGQMMRDKPLSEMARDLERITRRRPLLVAGVAALGGFIATQLFKSSPTQPGGGERIAARTPRPEAAATQQQLRSTHPSGDS